MRFGRVREEVRADGFGGVRFRGLWWERGLRCVCAE